MNIRVNNIASQLGTMSTEDLAQIRQLTDMLLGKQTEVQPTDDSERIIFEAVKAELNTAGINASISFANFSQSRQYKSWKRGVVVVTEFLNTSFKGYTKTEVARLAMSRILIQALILDFKQKGIPVSIGTIATNLHRVQQAFDNAFPSYLQSGLAYLIPQRLLRTKKA